jgi:hypothetical protein
MPKENDLEGPQDQGGKHGGQAGMPSHSPTAADQGIVRDESGQEQPRDKKTPRETPIPDCGLHRAEELQSSRHEGRSTPTSAGHFPS